MKQLWLFILCLTGTLFSQTILNVGVGPTWPVGLRENEKMTSWNATIEAARLFDNVVGFGADLDFSWNVNDSYSDKNDSTITKTAKDKTFMFPLSLQLFFDPIAKFKLHPVIRGQFGINMMVRDIAVYDSVSKEYNESIDDGFYIGFLGKGGIDAVFDLGEHASLYAGFEYQAGRLRHKITEGPQKDHYTSFNPNGPAIRMGMSFLF